MLFSWYQPGIPVWPALQIIRVFTTKTPTEEYDSVGFDVESADPIEVSDVYSSSSSDQSTCVSKLIRLINSILYNSSTCIP